MLAVTATNVSSTRVSGTNEAVMAEVLVVLIDTSAMECSWS